MEQHGAYSSLSRLPASGQQSGRVLSSLSLLNKAQGDQVLPLLYQCLEDDYFEATRSHACAALAATGPHLSSQQAAAAFQELLKCLDDSSNSVRVAAAAGLNACLSTSGWVLIDAALLQTLAVHLDDEDTAVQEAMCSVLSACAAQQPELVEAQLPAACSQHRSLEYVSRILHAASQQKQLGGAV